jgi:hypothetical protein
MSKTFHPMATELDHRQLAVQLSAQAKEQGVELVGPIEGDHLICLVAVLRPVVDVPPTALLVE